MPRQHRLAWAAAIRTSQYLENLLPQNQDGISVTKSSTFSRSTQIAQRISADPETVWHFLTTSAEYPQWNSTIVSMDGEISLGSKIKLVSTLDPSRTFNLKIKEYEPNVRLVWGDALGTRVFTLKSVNNGTRFEMTERIGGPAFPLFANKIPSFDESFNRFAADLKVAAEKGLETGSER